MTSQMLYSRLQREVREAAAKFRGVMTVHLCELTDGRRINVDGGQTLAAGSAIKVPVLMQLYRSAARGEIDLDAPHRVREEHIVGGSGVLQHLEGTVRLSLRDLAILMINVSDNAATNLCIDWAGMGEVNRLLEEIGCANSCLRRKMIDVDAVRAGRENLSSARDMSRWLEVLYGGEWDSGGSNEEILSVLHKRKDTPIRRAVPEEIPVTGKTGGLPRVRCEVALVQQERRPYVLAIMTAFGLAEDNSEAITGVARIVQEHLGVLDECTEYGRGLPSE